MATFAGDVLPNTSTILGIGTLEDSDIMRRRILVAVDGSEVFDRSLTRAAELARVLDAELHTITVQEQRPAFETIAVEVELPQAELDRYFSEVEYQIRRAAEEAGIRIASTKIIKGNPANEILRYIREASFDFVVLGRRNRRRGNYFRLGSTVRKVAAHAPCTIVLVPK
jgi:nucleotide-binding universal stress UspA family protein